MASTPAPLCVLDRDVVNRKTVGKLTDMGLSFFAPLCGKNRGAFVTDPPDGHTYGCLSLPQKWSDDLPVELIMSNDIKDQYLAKNLTATETVEVLDKMIKAVYQSSSNQETDPYACDAGGLAGLQCDTDAPDDEPIRSVTLAGLFVPFMGETKTLSEATRFYRDQDFVDMKAMGLNTVQIPVPLDAFEHHSTSSAIRTVMNMAEDAGLDVIITLFPGTDDVMTAARFAAIFCSENNVMALTLPDKSLIPAVRDVSTTLKLFVSINTGDYTTLEFGDDPNIYAALYMDHSTTVADVASSDSLNDRMKLFYHEAVACISRSPLEYAKCMRGVPVFVSGGFDISIDDCIKKDMDKQFHDYGQCDRFNETVGSGWWDTHRASFAARQVFAYERGMGWSYTTWKLTGHDDSDSDSDDALLDTPAKLLALKNVYAAGLFPVLDGSRTAAMACLNPPTADFTLGDDTLSPSAGPPPDCGNGWWNYETLQCDYWIPPTAAPSTETPTFICPECEVCPPPSPYTIDTVHQASRNSGVIGLVVGLILGAVVMKVCGGGRRDQGYSSIPN